MRRYVLFAAVCALLAACGAGTDAAAPLLDELRRELQPGIGLLQAQAALQARGATTSTRAGAECAALVEASRTSTGLRPRGGPCVFGKIPVAQGRFGMHTDVIVQLVFAADGRLADASFEALESWR